MKTYNGKVIVKWDIIDLDALNKEHAISRLKEMFKNRYALELVDNQIKIKEVKKNENAKTK